MGRHYYAIEWRYGRMWDNDGDRLGTYYSFPNKAARDKWVERGNPYSTQPGYREAIPASDRQLRRLLNHSFEHGLVEDVE